MKHHQAFSALRDVFTDIYRVEQMACTVALDAGLDPGQIVLSGRVKDVWTAILEEAEKQNAIADLVRVARKEYPRHPPLDAAVEAYAEAWVTDPQTPGARATELAYLAQIVKDYEYWAQRYTPLAGIAEVRRAVQAGPRLDLPMLFMPAGFEKLAEHGFGPDRRIERVPVEDLRQAVHDVRRLVLLGEPGAGKTTTLWRLAYDMALSAQSDTQAPLPLLVPLGGYSGHEPALAYVQGYFAALAPYLPAYLRHQRVILLLDGLNEMPTRGYAERVRHIQALLDTYKQAAVVVTCRALDYVETLNLRKLEVKPLDPPRQLAYVQHYLGDSEGESLFWEMAGSDVARLWEVWRAAGGTWHAFWTVDGMPKSIRWHTSAAQHSLWERLRHGEELPSLWALGRNPFMLVMLAQVYVAGSGTLPPNRAHLFAAFVDTLLAREAKRKHNDPAWWPGAETVIQCLAQLAFAMQEAGERGTAVEEAWAVGQLAPHTPDPAQVVYLAASASLVDLSNGRVRFVHQLLQEYFATLALRITGDNLSAFWPNGYTELSGWEEVMVLLGGLQSDLMPLVRLLLPVHPVLTARIIAESGAPMPSAETMATVQNTLIAIATGITAPVRARNLAGDALNYLRDPRPGVGLTPDGLPDIVWCDVSAGDFFMGNSQETDEMAWDVEAPPHLEHIPADYRISKYPITNAQYEAFVQDGGYTERWRHCWTEAGWNWRSDEGHHEPNHYGEAFGLPNHPVVGVAWYEASAFCVWLSAKLNTPVSLPTGAQWEKAARSTDRRRYPWGSEITSEHANWTATGIGMTSAVGIFPKGASPFGVLDLSGNVWEWCLTKWHRDYTVTTNNEAWGVATRVMRGGSFYYDHSYARCAVRSDGDPGYRSDNVGFRACIVKQQE